MSTAEREVGIEELAVRTGTPVRTIRYYVAEGLLPGPRGRGKAASYGDEHVLRLRLIRRLSEQRVPLGEIGARLARLTLDDVRSLLAEEEQHSAQLARSRRAASPRDYVSALLSRARSARQSERDAPAAMVSEAQPAPLLAAPAEPGESWRRFELAPGVELHVRADVQARHRPLIERLLKVGSARTTSLTDDARKRRR